MLTEENLSVFEKSAARENSALASAIELLVREVRSLQHELIHPNYQYAGGRIPRGAILCREAEIDRLREELELLKAAR